MNDLARPQANRLQRPSWRDSRLIVGVVLVLASMALGAKVVAAADETSPVYAAASTLVPGRPIAADQVRRVDVQLGASAGGYVSADQPLAPNAVAVREVRPGELLLVSAVGDREHSTLKPVMIPVDQDSASVLVVGSAVDVWVNRRTGRPGAGAGSDSYGVPVKMIAGASVSRVPDPSSGQLGSSRGTTGVQVMVPGGQVEQLIAMVDQGARVTLVPLLGTPQRAQ